MPDSTPTAGGLAGSVAAKWSTWSAIGAFGVYVVGYLALRFRLTALGVGTDLHLVDERYLFEGTRCLVYLVASAPVAIIIALPLLGLAWLGRRAAGDRFGDWWAGATGPLLLGAIVALLMIQFVMRQCFLFDNLLLRSALPAPDWFADLLTATGDLSGQLYFTLLFIGIAVPIGLGRAGAVSPARAVRALRALLVFLVAVQVLLLPVNYGVLMSLRAVPRLAAPPAEAGPDAIAAWLIWEGGDGLTFFVRGNGAARSLVTVPRANGPIVEIVGYDGYAEIMGATRAPDPELVDPPFIRAFEERRKTTTPVDPGTILLESLARIAGLTATPSAQRADLPPGAVAGDLCLMPVGGNAQRLTSDGGYRSPVFRPDGDAILTMRGDTLVEMDLAADRPRELHALADVDKLIGFDPDRPTILVYLTGGAGQPAVAAIDVESGRRERWDAAFDVTMLRQIRGEDRAFDDVRLHVRPVSDPLTEWTDVFVQQGRAAERNLTDHAFKGSSRQPSLSPDGEWVVFVTVPAQR